MKKSEGEPTRPNSREQGFRKFESHVSKDLWARYEKWAEYRGKIQSRQLLEAMFKLFLACPEEVQVVALFGKEIDLEGILAPSYLRKNHVPNA